MPDPFSGIFPAHARSEPAFKILRHHHAVVDEDAERDNECCKAHPLQRHAKEAKERDCGEHPRRHQRANDQPRAKSQKQDHDPANEEQRLAHVDGDAEDRAPDLLGLVGDRCELSADRQAVGELVSSGQNARPELQDARAVHHADGEHDGGLAVRVGALGRRGHGDPFNVGNVPQRHHLASRDGDERFANPLQGAVVAGWRDHEGVGAEINFAALAR
ncbi:MAG: hypothetical protein AAF318_20090 [Pseudomonadota bacterium]